MIPVNNLREVCASGVMATVSFGVSRKDEAHILGVLRDTLYSDKILAVLREYSANAWDAHREVGKSDIPIKVTLPTLNEPSLCIRDYGTGLSHESVFEVYTQYGASTKRGSNDSVGMLGIGSKSGFAYSDTFTITSWFGGMKSVYVAVLDASDMGELKLLHQEACGDETGIEIKIPVKQVDIYTFENTAKKLFQYFVPRPAINTVLPAITIEKQLKAGEMFADRAGEWVAVMGCIAYRVNIDQLWGVDNFNSQLFQELGGALRFNIGEVHINASREELKYSDSTKKALVAKLNGLVDEFVVDTLDKLKGSGFGPWQKRIHAQILRKMHIPLPKDHRELFAASVGLLSTPTTFSMHHGSSITNTVMVRAETTLFIQDDKRAIKGYWLDENHYVIKPLAGKTLDEVRVELDEMLAKAELTGITITNLSTRTWNQPTNARGGVKKVNPKHHAKSFKLKVGSSFCAPFSNCWETEEEREPADDDVYVMIYNFKSVSSSSFFACYQEDAKIAKLFGVTMPAVYGYKTTVRNPADKTKIVGIEYSEWRKKFKESLDKTKAGALIEALAWAKYDGSYYDYNDSQARKSSLERILNTLGDGHPVSEFAIKVSAGKTFANKEGGREFEYYLKMLVPEVFKKAEGEVKQAEKDLVKKYPMMKISNFSMNMLWESGSGNNAKLWLDYISLVDKG